MKILRNVKAVSAQKQLKKAAMTKFNANTTASMCLCRCSDG